VNGGIVIDGETHSMPDLRNARKCDLYLERIEAVRKLCLKVEDGADVYLEQVNSRPSDSPLTAFSLSSNYTAWIAFLAHRTNLQLVRPQEWQSVIPNLSNDYLKRKRDIKEFCVKRGHKVTLKTADAMAIYIVVTSCMNKVDKKSLASLRFLL
jgi:hypothetical protein